MLYYNQITTEGDDKMPRNSLDNALRFQKCLGNQTTCLTCAIQQSLNVSDPTVRKSYLCLECGEIITLNEALQDFPPCPSCGAIHYENIETL